VVAVEPFIDADALAVAAVSAKGLSLGDRTCLALAQRLGAPAVTAEHTWSELPLDVAVHLIRAK
jgi:PIN domain nuclease of toxin-antitoxin system